MIAVEGDISALLEKARHLKATKPKGWFWECKRIFKQVESLKDPYGTHERHGSESIGRKVHRTDGCPEYDDFSDKSDAEIEYEDA